jgi:hypothetical protein
MAYEYRFVRLELSRGFSFTARPQQDHRAIIDEHARQGWRLVQIFAPPTGRYGRAAYFELIFERPK